MDTAAISKRLDPLKLGLEATEMALREEIMSYFKGSCVRHLIQDAPIYLAYLSEYRQTRHSFERQKLEQERPAFLMLDNVPILALQQHPDTITFHTKVLGRSKEFRYLDKRIRKFMDTYLKGVRKEEDNADTIFFK